MKKIPSTRLFKIRVVVHSIYWLLLFAVLSTSSMTILYHLNRFQYALLSVFFLSIPTYYSFYLFKKLKANNWPTSTSLLVVVPLFIIPSFFANILIFHDYKVLFSQMFLVRYFLGNLFMILTLLILDQSVIKWEARKKVKALEEQLVRAELQSMRNLIHPHFLLNSLNNIYSLVHRNDPQSLEFISKLADLLRYFLYESSAEMIDVSNEVSFIQKYLDLQKIRNPAYQIKFEKPELDCEYLIPSRMLIHLVENCFKHSVTDQKGLHLIDISLKTSKNSQGKFLSFCSKNYSLPNQSSQKGIGIQTVKSVLDVFYKDGHLFELNEKEGFFYTRLEVPIG